MRKVSETEIAILFDFTRKHFVEFHDVRIELVDHLANGIEEQWQALPNLSFDDALQREFKKFGIFGFTDLVAEKQQALKRYYYGLIWKEFKTFFKLPKLILTGGLFYFFYLMYPFLATYTDTNDFAYIVFTICFLVVYVMDYLKYRKQLKQLSEDNKWLIYSVALTVSGGPMMLFYYLNYVVGFRLDTTELSLSKAIIMAVLSMIYCVFFIIMKTKIQPLLRDEVRLTQERFA